MTVRVRLALFGAVLPTVVLVVAVLVAGWRLRSSELEDLDRRLLAQAAVESVGLFDGPNGEPHVHLQRSPIADEVAELDTHTALYDARGMLVVEIPDPSHIPASLPPLDAPGVVALGYDEIAGRERRTLQLGVLSQRGERYTLWLGGSLAPLESSMTRYYAATLSVVAVLGLALLALQLVVAGRLARRIDSMTSFLPHLHDGPERLAPDPARDELGALREVLRTVATRLAEARLEQDRLLASAAHELRTPLTVLRTEVDLALRKERSADELREALRMVRADVGRIAALATALLDLQAVRHVQFERVPGDLATLVREACAGLRTMGEARQLDIRVTAPPAATARFDERALRQAVDNLVGNALIHAPAGTAIEVELCRRGPRWEIAVADAGPGVPADAAERIFEPFQRLATTTPGAGLGLAIAREVAQRHGGTCWLDCGYTDGARFVIALDANSRP